MKPTLEEKPFNVALANEAALDDSGWGLIAPFGRWPKLLRLKDGTEQNWIQVLDNESADALMNSENSFFGRLKRAVVGVPIYKGHGDLQDWNPKALANADAQQKIKVGVIDQIRKSERGLEAHYALDNEGAEAVRAGYKFPSAYWLVMPIANEDLPNGRQAIVAKPFKLLSAAITQFPNISGVECLANQRDVGSIETNETPKTNMTLKENLIGLLIGRGVKLSDPASDQEIMAALANDKADDSDADSGDCDKLTKKAHLASSRANSPETHSAAARAHQAAADAHDDAGHEDKAEMHQDMAKFHLRQSK